MGIQITPINEQIGKKIVKDRLTKRQQALLSKRDSKTYRTNSFHSEEMTSQTNLESHLRQGQRRNRGTTGGQIFIPVSEEESQEQSHKKQKK